MLSRVITTALIASFISTAAMGQDVYVNGYTRSDGTYVAPHYRSAPNETKLDNWSQQGNLNPYTGSIGTNEFSPFCSNSGYGSTPSLNNGYGDTGSRSSIFGN